MGKFEHVVVAFISSKAPEILEESDIFVDPQEEDWVGTGLLMASVIRLHKIVSIPQNLILRELGSFPYKMNELLTIKIKAIFQLK